MKTKEKQVKKSKRTITSLIISFLVKNPDAKFKDVPLKELKKIKPETKFNVYHWSWFKQQILKPEGRYHEKFLAMGGKV